MKKKIIYESKYLSKKKDKKSSQVYVVLGFLIFIFIIIIVVLFILFGQDSIENIEKKVKYDDFALTNEIRLLNKLKEYEILNNKIDDYLKEKLEPGFKRNIVYLKLYILLTLNDIAELKEFIIENKKIISKDDFLFLNGYIYYIEKNYTNSMKYLKKINTNNEIYRDASLIISDIYLKENNIKEAIKILEKIKNKDIIIFYNLAYLYLKNNDLNSALNCVNLIEKPNFSEPILLFKTDLLKTKIYMENEQYKKSLESLESLKEYPFLQDTYTYNNLVSIHLVEGNSKKYDYREIIDKLNNDTDNYSYLIYQLMFTILYFENQKSLAIGFFEKNKEKIFFDDYEKFLVLAIDIYNSKMNFIKSLELISNINLSSISEKYFTSVFSLYYNACKNENKLYQFENEAKMLFKNRKEKIFILNLLTESFIESSKIDEGIKFLLNERLFDNYPPFYYIDLAKLYMANNDEQKAFKYLKIIEKMDIDIKEKDEIYLFLCKYYLKTKKLEDFKNLFSLISEEERKKSENLLLYLEYNIQLKNYNSIIESVEKLDNSKIKDDRILFYIAKSYYEIKEYDKAIIYFSRLFEKIEDKKLKASFAIYLGNCYAYDGNISTALFYYKQANLLDNEQTYSKVNSQILEKINN